MMPVHEGLADHKAPALAIENNLFRLGPLSSLRVDSGACVVRIRSRRLPHAALPEPRRDLDGGGRDRDHALRGADAGRQGPATRAQVAHDLPALRQRSRCAPLR